MGLYDTVHSRFSLPHHQDADSQTKHVEHLVGGVSGLGGMLSEYEITPKGGLRVRVHDREWRSRVVRRGLSRVGERLVEQIPDVNGDIRIYTRDADEFVDFQVRFTDGRGEPGRGDRSRY